MLGITRFRPFGRTEEFDKRSFEMWLEKGSLAAANFELRKQGVVKPDGTPYTNAGVRFAALRYYILNYPESRKQIESNYKKRGFIGAPESMDKATINYAFEIIHRLPTVVSWLKEFNLYDDYEDYIQEKINKRKLTHGKETLES